MKCLQALFLLMAVAGVAQTTPNTMGTHATSEAKTIVIRAGTLIDGTSAQPKKNQVIVIRGNRIISVGDAGAAQAAPGAQTLDLSQATVLPGLIDTPTHIFLQGEDPAEGGYDVQLLKYPASFRAARATMTRWSAGAACCRSRRRR